MFQPSYGNSYNGSQYNFTEPFNSTIGDVENTNASRHFADQPQSEDIFHDVPLMVIYMLSIVPCGLIIIGGFLWFHDCKMSRRMQRSSRTDMNEEGGLGGSYRPNILSVIQNSGADQMFFQSGDETPIIDTPSSIYPSDLLPNFSDSSRNLCSDTITTPLSNNSIITMTMRNNYLIVETEERVPINCSSFNSEEVYTNSIQNVSAFMVAECDDYSPDDFLDDANSFSEDQQNLDLCTISEEERRSFYEPTTSRQAQSDEEDEHGKMFHENLRGFPNSPFEPEGKTDPSCIYKCNEEQLLSYTGANTGLTQSDLTGSSSSTSRRAQIDYTYSNQSEYTPFEIPQRRRSSSLKLLSCNKKENLATSFSFSFPKDSSQDSVLQVTDCSFLEFSGPSK